MNLQRAATSHATVDRSELANALQYADLRVLLMVLVHCTGNLEWLEPPFTPRRDVRLIPAPDAGLPDDVQQRIRDAALEVLMEGGPSCLPDPGDALMQRMMSVCLGEKVPFEYAEMNREEMGIKPRLVAWPGAESERTRGHVLIVGAGVCGLALGVNLKRLGVPFTILEKNADVGGTWFANRYPGCGVDTPNHAYSFSFGSPYPWPRYFSRREDVHAYLQDVADTHRLREHIRFGATLEQAAWDDEIGFWVAQVEEGGVRRGWRTRFLVSANGQLSDPAIPDIRGSGEFKGRIFHSSNWPEDLDVTGLRVAVIGTGATAMQLVPAIAGQAAQVDVYQRTAQWARAIPGHAAAIAPEVQYLMQHVPMYAQWFRFNMFWHYGDGLLRHLKVDPTWEHPWRAVNAVNDRHRQEMTDFIVEQLQGRDDLLAQCIPDYPAYGKRILLDNNWYVTLRRSDVALLTERIDGITATGVRLESGAERFVDVIVFATGFKLAELAARLKLTGRGGQTLAIAWGQDSPSAYLGLMVPGFPNFFCMLGPGSGPGHGGSAVFQAECQARYITSCIAQMAGQNLTSIEIGHKAFERYMASFDEEHRQLVWAHPAVTTYYKGASGRVFTVMPWRFVDYWRMTHDANLADFDRR